MIPGPTGEPALPGDPHDQGGLAATLSIEPVMLLLRLDFGKPITFLRFSHAEATAFAAGLLANAAKLKELQDARAGKR